MNRSIHEFDQFPQQGKPATGGDAADRDRAEGRRGADKNRPQSGKIGIIYNPRSHRNKGRDLDCADDANVLVARPERREDITEALSEFAQQGVHYLIINGGDGTVRDVLTAAAPVFGDKMPLLAVLPKGKTNALNVDLGAPKDWNVSDAIAALESGGRCKRRPLEITQLGEDNRASAPVRGFILGAGAFTLGTQAGQSAHSLGFFNSLAVGATTLWGILQALFGTDRNPWRRGVAMQFILPETDGDKDTQELAHSGFGGADRRAVALATTLRRMPLGAKPFGPEREGLKLAVMDKPRRRLLAVLPLVVTGWQSPWLARAGLHQTAPASFELTIGDAFILDGEAFPAGRYRVTQGPELTFVIA
jgi:hypothetical protein